jgi:hypothetical protein
MNPFPHRKKLRRIVTLFAWSLLVVSLDICSSGTVALADLYPLRPRGRTLVEAENFSAASPNQPRTESSPWCSGQSNLGYFWLDSWFELNVDVPRLLNYNLSLRVSSLSGTTIDVLLVDQSGMTRVGEIEVPNTQSWVAYEDTEPITISLPAGPCTLRFLNRTKGANVDFVVFAAGSLDDVITSELAATSGPDKNPLKGFHSGWQRANDDFASLGLQFLEWGKFEPEDDVFNWEYVEEVLDRAGTRGRHFILQFVVDWDDSSLKEPNGRSHYRGPDWLLQRVGETRGPIDPDDPNSRISRATRYDDRIFLEEASEAITTLLERYRDDPRAFVFPTGVLGFWGQWSTFPRNDWNPSRFAKAEILSTYLSGLEPDGFTQIRNPRDAVADPQKGIGYSNSMAAPTRQGYEFGERVANRRLWRNGPITGEWPAHIETSYWQRFFQDTEGLFFIEKGRYTTLMLPESLKIKEVLPDWEQDDLFLNMHRKMGYNFQVTSVRHLVSSDISHRTCLEVDLQNIGIAPFYKRWKIQLAILNAATGEPIDVIPLDLDIRNLGPNESTTLAVSSLKRLEPSDRYQIGLRILQPGADEAKVSPWKLDARNAYVVLANQIRVIDGAWADDPQLEKNGNLIGGWNILDTIQRREPTVSDVIDNDFFPYRGSFRP